MGSVSNKDNTLWISTDQLKIVTFDCISSVPYCKETQECIIWYFLCLSISYLTQWILWRKETKLRMFSLRKLLWGHWQYRVFLNFHDEKAYKNIISGCHISLFDSWHNNGKIIQIQLFLAKKNDCENDTGNIIHGWKIQHIVGWITRFIFLIVWSYPITVCTWMWNRLVLSFHCVIKKKWGLLYHDFFCEI